MAGGRGAGTAGRDRPEPLARGKAQLGSGYEEEATATEAPGGRQGLPGDQIRGAGCGQATPVVTRSFDLILTATGSQRGSREARSDLVLAITYAALWLAGQQLWNAGHRLGGACCHSKRPVTWMHRLGSLPQRP